MNPPQPEAIDWQAWLASWDRQQEDLLPDREERIAAMFDVVEAAVGAPRRVLDLASGPGSIALRLLHRFPDVDITLVDVDPALLAIANGVLGADRRVRIVRADLVNPRWVEALGTGKYDAAVTANSLHWLDEGSLRRVYADLGRLVRSGGVVCNADRMPPERVERWIAALERQAHAVPRQLPPDGLDWEAWWQAAARDPVLAPLVAERMERFGGESHPPEFMPPLRWHVSTLLAAGFIEAGCVWRQGADAIVAALR